jgi:nitrous oxide reductase accessory protein NosL
MKKIWIALLLCLSFCSLAHAAGKVEAPADCIHCGMNRTSFASSRMVVTYADGSNSGTCSLHCVVTDLRGAQGKKVKSFRVADHDTLKLLDARKATWVIGGKERGVMTQVAKWAFVSRTAAAAFIRVNGGRLATFDEALAMAWKE